MKEAHETIPHLFRCPISLDLFKDPVTLCTGQTYERSSIEKWLATGNLTCPVTMQKLNDPSFVPNNNLRHLITQWLQMGDGDQINPHCLSAIDSLAALRSKLESNEFSFGYKLQVLQRVRILSEEFPSCNSCLVQFGFLSVLLELVFGQTDAKLSQEYQEFVERALGFVVTMVSLGQLQSLNVLMEESKLSRFIDLFNHGTPMIKISLCHLVEAISSSVETKDLGALLGNATELLHEIVRLLHQSSEASDAATKAIFSLSNLEQNAINLVADGAVAGLISYISNAQRRERSSARVAMAAIEKLLVIRSAKEEVVNSTDGVNAIVKMVFRVSDHGGSESAVSSLIILCYDSVEAREEAIRGGVLSQLLLLLQSQCCVKTKTKARILLKLLRSKWVEDKRNM
ncbi:U-box domain-containing protein 26-like [Momordica charantia]|uniref:U-box domain-containing protein n=1 Tax=Momordica charantia TaxID=3673 RepID=A0A6J1DU80_MOMCH|nr:U-box domain-containing protein 26-like [Momordica charantia]